MRWRGRQRHHRRRRRSPDGHGHSRRRRGRQAPRHHSRRRWARHHTRRRRRGRGSSPAGWPSHAHAHPHAGRGSAWASTSHRAHPHAGRRSSPHRWRCPTRWRWDKSGPDPRPFSRFGMDVKANAGNVVDVFLPSIGKGWDERIVFSAGFEKRLLRSRQSHGSATPFGHMFLVMHFEILSKFPSPSLLFPSRGTVVRQIGVGIIVKKAGHFGWLCWMVAAEANNNGGRCCGGGALRSIPSSW